MSAPAAHTADPGYQTARVSHSCVSVSNGQKPLLEHCLDHDKQKNGLNMGSSVTFARCSVRNISKLRLKYKWFTFSAEMEGQNGLQPV